MRFQIIGFTLGLLITILGAAQMLPALVDWLSGHPNAEVFLFNGLVCLFSGGGLVIVNRNFERHFTIKEAFLLTSLSWVVMAAFAALPFYMGDVKINYAQAYFEAMSGFTTTGSTVLVGLDKMSKGILLWRSMTQGIGGIGIVAFAMILLPFLRIGGMQLFQTESSDRSDKVMARSNHLVKSLLVVYLLIIAACVLVYYVLGMSWFDAINHALATVSTGGFSTQDSSFAFFQEPLLHYACIFFMFLGALPFVLFVKLLYQGKFAFWRDEQVRAFSYILIILSLSMTLWVFLNTQYSFEESFRYSLFSIMSIITTTGFAVTDYTLWGSFAVIFFLLLTYIGACAGSTAGGAKIMRLLITGRVVHHQFKMLLFPNGHFPLKYQEKNINSSLIMGVLVFLSLYVLFNVVLALALTLCGLDFYTAISGAATAIANVGPGIGRIIGPAGNFSTLPNSALWLLSFGMLVGRLEILTVLVLFSPRYWQK